MAHCGNGIPHASLPTAPLAPCPFAQRSDHSHRLVTVHPFVMGDRPAADSVYYRRMLKPGRYLATATDGSGETIILNIVGSRIDAGYFGDAHTNFAGPSEAIASDGRRMTPTEGDHCFTFAGETQVFEVTGQRKRPVSGIFRLTLRR